VVSAEGIFIIDILEFLARFKERHDIFIHLLSLDVIFFCKELLCPTSNLVMLLAHPETDTIATLITNNTLNRNKMDIGVAKLTVMGKCYAKKIDDQGQPVNIMIIRCFSNKKAPI
jgi:hypothetical protein